MINFTLKNVHYSIITYNELNKSIYSKPKRLNGEINLITNVEEEKTTTVYADDSVYYTTSDHQGYFGYLTITTPSREFSREVFSIGDFKGALYEEANAKVKEIALLFEIDGDESKNRVILYRVLLNRGSYDYKTDAYIYDFKAIQRSDDEKVKSFIENDGSLQYDNWFEQIY